MSTAWNLADLYVVVDGDRIEASAGGGDLVSFSQEGDRLTPVRGADGALQYQYNPNVGLTVTLSLMFGSTGIDTLERLRQEPRPTFSLSIDHEDGGISLAEPNAKVLTGIPDVSLGQATGDVEYAIFCPNPSVVFASTNQNV